MELIPLFLVTIKSSFLLAAVYLFVKACLPEISKKSCSYTQILWHLMGLFLLCNIAENILYIIQITHYTSVQPIITLSSLFIKVLGYCALGFFLEKLTYKHLSLEVRHSVCMIGFLSPMLALIPSLIFVAHQLRTTLMPRMLKRHLQQLFRFLVIPPVVLTVATLSQPFVAEHLYQIMFIILKDIFTLAIAFFCMRYLLRSQPLQKKVPREQLHLGELFTFQFKELLTQLGQTASFAELETITRTYLSETFPLKPQQISLHILLQGSVFQNNTYTLSPAEELMYNPAHKSLHSSLITQRVLVREALELDFYYEENEEKKLLLYFLDTARAEHIIPIYREHTLLAYIAIQPDAQSEKLLSDQDRYKMRFYADYLGLLVNLLQHRNVAEVARKQQIWREDIYHKEQELKHYKESLKTLLESVTNQPVGVIHYSCKKLIWMCQTACTFFGIKQSDSPETIIPAHNIKEVAQNALRYRAEQYIVVHNHENRAFHCTAAPGDDSMNSIILIHPADHSDQFSLPLDELEDISSWNYALYLQATSSGKLINDLIPDSEKTLLNFKIELFKVALSAKALLLSSPETDFEPLVRIIHHISSHSHLHTYLLQEPEQHFEIGRQLFGVRSPENNIQQGLLCTLPNNTTLYIQNVEHLSFETQQQLAVYITTGIFLPHKSTLLHRSTVRIICSTRTPLELLAARATFSQELLNELRTANLVVPSISYRTSAVACEQATEKPEEHHVAQEAELAQLATERIAPVETSHFSPDITRAIELGKEALKDRRLMSLLWETFQNQTTIATLLKVNPSLVHRRCKEFNLPPDNALS